MAMAMNSPKIATDGRPIECLHATLWAATLLNVST